MTCDDCKFYIFDPEVGQKLCEARPGDICPVAANREQDEREVVRLCHSCGYDLDGAGAGCPKCGVINEWL